jgi:hypothetical protein
MWLRHACNSTAAQFTVSAPIVRGDYAMPSNRKRVTFALGMLIGLSVARGQVPVPDTLLHLKNGDEVRGTLVEIKNGAYVLTLPDGRTALYPTSDVATAERLPGTRALSSAKGVALLAPGQRVYVRPVPERDIHEVVANLLRDWGRWKVVDKPDEADILVRLVLSGSAAWGRASIVATIEEAPAGAELWKSKKQTGNRTIFHGYTSPYNRAAEGILEQLKKVSAMWPKE